MGTSEVSGDPKALRRFDDDTFEADAAILGACEVVETALANLRAGADGIDVPGGLALELTRDHHVHVLALGDLFELAADRFHRSQERHLLPWVFAWHGARSLGPGSWGTGWHRRPACRATTASSGGPPPRRGPSNTDANRRWLERTLGNVRRRAATEQSRRIAADLRRELDVVAPPRVLLGSRQYEFNGGGSVVVGFDAGLVWDVKEYSDGTAEVTLRFLHDVTAELGAGGEARANGVGLPIGANPLLVAASASFGLTLGAQKSRAWTKTFPSVAAADDFVHDHGTEALVDRAANLLPWLDGLFDPGGMQSSPQHERWSGRFIELDSVVGGQPLGSGEDGAYLESQVAGAVTFGQATDETAGLHTQMVLLAGAIGAASMIAGESQSQGKALSMLVAVSRDERGSPTTLTVASAWSGDAGQRPEGVPPAAERRSTDTDAATHLYRKEVRVDLQDPRNAALARQAAALDGGESALDARQALQLGLAVDDPVRARSLVTFEELELGEPEGVDVSADGGAVFGAAMQVSAISQETRVVAAWSGPDDRLRQVVGT